jgi:hypothetical protein
VFPQAIGIPMGTNCGPLIADLFLHAYDADFLQGLLNNKYRTLLQPFKSSFYYIHGVLSRNNTRFDDYLHLIFQKDLKVKCLLLTLIFILNREQRKLKTKLYDKRDDFIFPTVIPICSNQ